MGEFRMPSLGADMEYGTLIEWLVHPGDQVRRGDVVAVVDTDKSTIDVEVFESGHVAELLVEPGERVPVGTVLARLTAAGTTPEATAAPEPTAPARVAPQVAPPVTPTAPPTIVTPASPPVHAEVHAAAVISPLVRRVAAERHVDLDALVGSGPGGQITRHDVEEAGVPAARAPGSPTRASPYARRLAREAELDIGGLSGSGPNGAVVARDVRAAASTRPTERAPQPETDRAVTMRRRIGEVMSRSHREIPQYHLALTIDLERALAWLREQNEQRSPADRVLPAALLLHQTAIALREVPGFNGYYLDGAYRPSDEVHLGVAVAMRGGGLIVPVIRQADQLDVTTIMRTLRDIVGRARSGRLRSSEVMDATVTVTDLGDRSIDAVYGIIHPPQVALVGIGQVAVRPWVVDGEVVARSLVTVTLTGDHRVTDGHDGARLLQTIERRLQDMEGSR
ncbi:MAG: dihydrolipoamide acetyltransferase family protein [Acidimicrobiia bacterium]